MRLGDRTHAELRVLDKPKRRSPPEWPTVFSALSILLLFLVSSSPATASDLRSDTQQGTIHRPLPRKPTTLDSLGIATTLEKPDREREDEARQDAPVRPEFRLAAGPVHYRLFDPVYETPWMISGRILFRTASGFGFGWGVGYYEIHGVQGIPVMFDVALPGFPAGSVVSPFITLSAYSAVEKGDTGDYDSLPSIPCPPEGCSGGSRNRGWRTQGMGFGACGGIRLEIGEHARLFLEGRAYPIGNPGMATAMVGVDLVP